jgi:hypothetical protein
MQEVVITAKVSELVRSSIWSCVFVSLSMAFNLLAQVSIVAVRLSLSE